CVGSLELRCMRVGRPEDEPEEQKNCGYKQNSDDSDAFPFKTAFLAARPDWYAKGARRAEARRERQSRGSCSRPAAILAQGLRPSAEAANNPAAFGQAEPPGSCSSLVHTIKLTNKNG